MAVAADIMTRNVVTVSPDTSVRDVAALLATKRFGSVPVVDDTGKVLGIVTEEDMVLRAANVHLPRHIMFLGSIVYLENPQNFQVEADKILALTARDIMHETFASIGSDTPIDDVASRMLNEDLRRVLVLDADEKLIGIITRADIVRMLFSGDRLPDMEQGT